MKVPSLAVTVRASRNVSATAVPIDTVMLSAAPMPMPMPDTAPEIENQVASWHQFLHVGWAGHAPLASHVIELEPTIPYPLSHAKSHVGLPEAAPPAHEAPAAPVLVEAATSMAGHVTSEQVG